MKTIFRFSVLLALLFCATVVRAQQNCAYARATHQTPDGVTYSPDGLYIVSQTVTYSVQCTNSGNGSPIGPPQTNSVTAKGDYDYHVRFRCDPQFTTRNYSSGQWVNATFDNIGQSRYYNEPQSQCEDNGPASDTQTICQPQACPSGACGAAPPPPNRLCPPDEQWIWDDTTCSWTCDYPTTPVLVDVSGHGFELTSAAGGVSYDIRGNGVPVQIAWTAPGAQNAFLCLPDSNGTCDDGKDLFGNFTPQPASATPNGFAALTVYDNPGHGGNGDGIIDARDAIFSSLRLWIDANHDGISQPNEVFTLPQLGITSISLNYKLDKRTDQYGNVFRYRAEVGSTSGAGRMAYDVFLVTQRAGTTAATLKVCPQRPLLVPADEKTRLR